MWRKHATTQPSTLASLFNSASRSPQLRSTHSKTRRRILARHAGSFTKGYVLLRPIQLRPISTWAKFDSGQFFLCVCVVCVCEGVLCCVCVCCVLCVPLDRPSAGPPKFSLFFSLSRPIFALFPLLESLLVELWSRIAAMDHPKCASRLPGAIL